MSELLNNQDTEKNAHRLIKYFKWTFVPVLNIDGYEYSRTTDRMVRIILCNHQIMAKLIMSNVFSGAKQDKHSRALIVLASI
jgi:murein tripeptide amidase MpaA